MANKTNWYSSLAKQAARFAGRPLSFTLASVMILMWLIIGPIFHFNEKWHMSMDIIMTAFTFLMVFIIQNTQNRDTEAIQIKLDDLIRSTKGAHNELLDLEELEEETLDSFRTQYEELARKARSYLHDGKSDKDTPEIKT